MTDDKKNRRKPFRGLINAAIAEIYLTLGHREIDLDDLSEPQPRVFDIGADPADKALDRLWDTPEHRYDLGEMFDNTKLDADGWSTVYGGTVPKNFIERDPQDRGYDSGVPFTKTFRERDLEAGLRYNGEHLNDSNGPIVPDEEVEGRSEAGIDLVIITDLEDRPHGMNQTEKYFIRKPEDNQEE